MTLTFHKGKFSGPVRISLVWMVSDDMSGLSSRVIWQMKVYFLTGVRWLVAEGYSGWMLRNVLRDAQELGHFKLVWLACANRAHNLSSSRSRTGLLHMSIRISKRSSNSPQSMPKRVETTEVSIGDVQTYSDLKNPFHTNPQQQCAKHTAKYRGNLA